jgi:hypothetical protein
MDDLAVVEESAPGDRISEAPGEPSQPAQLLEVRQSIRVFIAALFHFADRPLHLHLQIEEILLQINVTLESFTGEQLLASHPIRECLDAFSEATNSPPILAHLSTPFMARMYRTPDAPCI